MLCVAGALFLLVNDSSSDDPRTVMLFPAGPAVASEAVSLPPDFKQRHEQFGVPCVACHGADMSEQVPPVATCLQCHGSNEELAELTKDVFPNPHVVHHIGELRCTQCHKEHTESVLQCNQCHIFEMEVP